MSHRNFPSSSSRPSTSLYELARCTAAATTTGPAAAAVAVNAILTASMQRAVALALTLSELRTIIDPELIRILDRLEERERLSHLTDDSQNN